MSFVTTAELERLAAELGHRRRRRGPGRALRGDRAAHRERRARGLFADMRFTMARPEVSCHPETLLPDARTVVSAALCYYAPEPDAGAGRGSPARATRGSTRTRSSARSSTRSAGRLGGEYRVLVDENDHVDREGAVRVGRRLLRQEHDADHAASRVLGRARDARHGRRDRALRAARARLRLVHALHRRLPDRSARRARHARLDALPLVLDAGARRRSPRSTAASSEPRSTAATSARTSARGTAGSRSAARTRFRRPDAEPHVSLVEWLEAGDEELRARYERLYFPRKDPRYLRRNALVAAGNSGDPELRPAVERTREKRRPPPARARGVGSRAARRGQAVSPELERRWELERWISLVRLIAVSWAVVEVGLLSASPARYESLPGSSRAGSPSEHSSSSGWDGGECRVRFQPAVCLTGLVFDTAVIWAYALVFTFESGTRRSGAALLPGPRSGASLRAARRPVATGRADPAARGDRVVAKRPLDAVRLQASVRDSRSGSSSPSARLSGGS